MWNLHFYGIPSVVQFLAENESELRTIKASWASCRPSAAIVLHSAKLVNASRWDSVKRRTRLIHRTYASCTLVCDSLSAESAPCRIHKRQITLLHWLSFSGIHAQQMTELNACVTHASWKQKQHVLTLRRIEVSTLMCVCF